MPDDLPIVTHCVVCRKVVWANTPNPCPACRSGTRTRGGPPMKLRIPLIRVGVSDDGQPFPPEACDLLVKRSRLPVPIFYGQLPPSARKEDLMHTAVGAVTRLAIENGMVVGYGHIDGEAGVRVHKGELAVKGKYEATGDGGLIDHLGVVGVADVKRAWGGTLPTVTEWDGKEAAPVAPAPRPVPPGGPSGGPGAGS